MGGTGEVIRVLHVDDDRDFANLVATFLEREDERFAVETAQTASVGLDRLAFDPFDCVVSDYDMPERNGIEFLEAVRETHPDVPFILYTGKGSEEVAADAISVGVTDYLQKQRGTDQYVILANRVENAVAQYNAEQEVEQSKQYFGTILEHASDYVMIVDAEAEIEYVSPAVERILGYDPASLADVDPFSMIHPDDTAVATEAFGELLGHPEQVQTVVYRARHADGSWRWLEVSGRNLLDDPVIEGILVNVRDVTDRKAREQEVHAHVTAMEAATDGIAILDEDQEYVYVNAAHAEIYGFDDPDALRGRTWRACYDDAEIPRFEGEILPALFEDGRWQGSMTVTAADGRTFEQDLSLTRLDTGRVVCVVRAPTPESQ